MSVVSEAEVDWIDAELTAFGRSRTGPVEVARDRPWALVAHMPTAEGRVWFKANRPDFAYEAAALGLLGSVRPDSVLVPIAVEAESGWFLSDDVGQTGTEVGVSVLDVAALYADVQRASSQLTEALLAVGVPDRRPGCMLAIFDAVVNHPKAGEAAARCTTLRTAMVESCALLDDGQAVIVNSDVKPEHVFVGPPMRLYDWGDAVISHPLASLASLARLAEPSGEEAAALLEPWDIELGSARARAGVALGALIGADVWTRDMPGVFDRHPGALGRALARLAECLERW